MYNYAREYRYTVWETAAYKHAKMATEIFARSPPPGATPPLSLAIILCPLAAVPV